MGGKKEKEGKEGGREREREGREGEERKWRREEICNRQRTLPRRKHHPRNRDKFSTCFITYYDILLNLIQ